MSHIGLSLEGTEFIGADRHSGPVKEGEKVLLSLCRAQVLLEHLNEYRVLMTFIPLDMHIHQKH